MPVLLLKIFLKKTVIIRIHDSAKYIGEKSYHGRHCGSRTSQIQVHCKRSLTYVFGHGLVPLMEANYYKGWSEMRKVTLNLAISIHCPILVSLSRVFTLKGKKTRC